MRTQEQSLRSVGSPLKGPESVQGEAFHVSTVKDDSMRYLKYLLFERMQLLVLNYSLYSDGKMWLELEKYRSQGQA